MKYWAFFIFMAITSIHSGFSSTVKHFESYPQQLKIESPVVTMYNYLIRNFHQSQDCIFLIKPSWLRDDPVNDSICGYHIMFKEGHSIKHEQECNEWGEIVTVSFKNINSEQVKKLWTNSIVHQATIGMITTRNTDLTNTMNVFGLSE